MKVAHHCSFFPESVWAKGSSNSGGLSNIFTSSHPHIFTFSHLHILTSSHLFIFSSSHLHIFSSPSHLLIVSSSHLLIFTSSHLHICSSSHLHIFTSAHLHIFSSSHLHIFTSSHLHIFSSCPLGLLPSSSHLLILTSSHLHIFITSSHPHILTSPHPHILTSSHLHILTSSHLHILSCSLALLLSPSFPFLSWRRGAVPTRRHETQPFRTKWGSIAKNCGKIAISGVRLHNPFARNGVRSPKTAVKLRCAKRPANLFVRNEGFQSLKTEVKLRFWFVLVRVQPFRVKWGSIAKNWNKIAICKGSGEPFRTKWGSISKNGSRIAISRVRLHNPFARNEVRSPKTEVKLRFAKGPANIFARNLQKLR